MRRVPAFLPPPLLTPNPDPLLTGAAKGTEELLGSGVPQRSTDQESQFLKGHRPERGQAGTTACQCRSCGSAPALLLTAQVKLPALRLLQAAGLERVERPEA
ncbi:hypothetical protein H920_15419 [Fukomys damarensis]|uniref:Uncharacterized protein n=1 Tax=Fukomys damarensis TaxID=885580 RepID=A0A091CUN5_FUKDA|nr:hypothetical protein H920_15419 [Fukomys damarensis]